MTDGRPGTINLGGDLMFQRRLDSYGLGEDFTAALGALRDGDLAIVNLEMPLSRRGYRVPKYANLRCDPDIIDDVRAMGIDAVALANNHMMDYGPDAMFDTIAACERAGIPYSGAGADIDAALKPAMLTAGGTRVALLSVASTLPLESNAAPGKPGIAPLRIGFSFETDISIMAEQPGMMPVVHSWPIAEALEVVTRRVAEAKATADLVIVGIHWGVPDEWLSPYTGLLAEYQQTVGRALIDAGADVVWGHHSHSLHPIEVYRGKPIIYSLGNFVFDWVMHFMKPESVIVRITAGDPLDVRLIPIWVADSGFPRLATGAEGDKVLRLLSEISEPFGTRIEVTDGQGRLVIAE